MASVDQSRQQRKDIHMMKHSLLTVRRVTLAYSTYKQENLGKSIIKDREG